MKRKHPELRIIDQEIWEATQLRLSTVRAFYTKTADGKPKGRALSGKFTSYPLSGLLFCGECGAPMIICGGTSQKYYGCGDAKKRGTCKNRLSLREDIARSCLLQFLRDKLASPSAVRFIRKTVAEELGVMSRKTNAEIDERRARLQRTEERIGGLVSFIADGDSSEYVRTTLLDLEAQAKAEKRAIADLREQEAKPVRLPSPEETARKALDFEAVLLKDPARGREELRRMFEGERIVLRPQPEGFYVAEGTLYPLALFSLRIAAETPKARDSEESPGLLASLEREPKFACSSSGCAGRI